MKINKISIIGLGYIGLPTAAIFASKKIKVVGVDTNEKIVNTINQGKIHIIENAVNLDRISILESDRELKVFAYIGTISPIEGLDLLIKAFIILNEEGFKNKLFLYGDGVMLPQLRILAKDCDFIEFKGRFSQDQISDVYSEVDIIVNPRKKSFLTDSVTPLKPLEAMGYKKLIMASNIGGMR